VADGEAPKAGNLRDLGGFSTRDGRTVRHGVLYRSEAVDTLDDASRSLLSGVPMKVVFDLRSHDERESIAALWAATEAPEIVHVPVIENGRVGGLGLTLQVLLDESGREARNYMFGIYSDMIVSFAESCLSEFDRRVGIERQLPVLIHCTAGKDRTGVLSALVLLALGVSREDVVADYQRSVHHFGPDRIKAYVLDIVGDEYDSEALVAAIAPLGAHREYLDLVIDSIIDAHGSIEAYWEHAKGVAPGCVQRLREALLV
jgi:protein-tyrosine phosphatase